MNWDFITENRFIKHYMDIEGIGIFLLFAFLGLVVILGILLLYAKKYEEENEQEDMEWE